MKVVLVCMSAVTTNILANKLNIYAREKDFDDNFMAVKIDFFSNVIDNTDLFLIAPQASFSADQLKKECKDKGIPYIEMEEEEFVFKDVIKIYQKINQFRKKAEKNEKKQVNFNAYLKTYRNASISVLMILVFSLPCFLFYKMMGFEPFKIIYDLTGGIAGLYFLLYVGYEFGKNSGINPIYSVFLILTCSLIMIPTISFGDEYDFLFHATKGFMYLEYFSPSHLWVSVICSMTVLLLIRIWSGVLDRLHVQINEYSLLSVWYLNLFPIGVSLLLRVLVKLFL